MTIDHALVTSTFSIADPAGDIVLEEGKILMGEADADFFAFPLTSRDGITRIEVIKPFSDGDLKYLPKKNIIV